MWPDSTKLGICDSQYEAIPHTQCRHCLNWRPVPDYDYSGPELTGIQRHQAEEAQAKLKQRRWERDHFSDGVPVAVYEGIEVPDEEGQTWDV